MTNGILILNVNTDRAALNENGRILRAAGLDVRPATTAAEALALVRTEKPALVLFLVDEDPPDMSVASLNRRIEADPNITNTVIVHTDRCMSHKADGRGYLGRLDPQELVATIRYWVKISQYEQAALKIQERFRSVVAANEIGVFLANLDKICDANEAFLEMTGYTREHLSAGTIGWKEIAESPEFAARELLPNAHCRVLEPVLIRSTGSRFPTTLAVNLFSEVPMMWTCYVLNCDPGCNAARPEAATAVRTIAYSTLPDGSCDFVNRGFYEYTGAPHGSAEGFGWIEAVFPDDAQTGLPTVRQSIEAGRAFEVECRIRRSDGVYRWFAISSRPCIGADGQILRWLGSFVEQMHRENEGSPDAAAVASST